MDPGGKVAVVTGGGIGAALARAFADHGAQAVVVADIDGDRADRVAGAIAAGGATAVGLRADAGAEADGARLARDVLGTL
ncbi:MAG TPA: SDR family NAD(P)-dependent oxidoreductase [Acidimicrobiales bacterium]